MMGPLRFGIPVTISCTICADNLQVLDFNCNPLLKKVETLSWLTFCETTLSFKYLEQRGQPPNKPSSTPWRMPSTPMTEWLAFVAWPLEWASQWASHAQQRVFGAHVAGLVIRSTKGQHFDCLSFRQEFDQTHCRWVYCLWGSIGKIDGRSTMDPHDRLQFLSWSCGVGEFEFEFRGTQKAYSFRCSGHPSICLTSGFFCCLGMLRKHDKSHPYQRV